MQKEKSDNIGTNICQHSRCGSWYFYLSETALFQALHVRFCLQLSTRQPLPPSLRPAPDPAPSSWSEQIPTRRGTTTGYKGKAAGQSAPGLLEPNPPGPQGAEHSNAASPLPAVTGGCGKLAGEGSPGRGSRSFARATEEHRERQVWPQGLFLFFLLLLPCLAALIPPWVLPLFRGLTQNPPCLPLCSLEDLRLPETQRFLLHHTEKLRSVSRGQQQWLKIPGDWFFFSNVKKRHIFAF